LILKKPIPNIAESAKRISINSNISYLNFGQKRHLFSWLWIETLLFADIAHYQGRPLENWLYQRFKSILTLDPNFLFGYQFAGLYLSVISDDIAGATSIYNMGLAKFPEDYVLNINAAVHFLKEEKDLVATERCLRKILSHPDFPPELIGLWATVKLKMGESKDHVIQALEDLYLTIPSVDAKAAIKYKIRRINHNEKPTN
jgi:hypothetical protein